MGGGRSRTNYETHTVVQTSAATVAQIQQHQQQVNQLQQQVQELKDPSVTEEKIFMAYLDKLTTFDIYEPMPKEAGVQYVGMFGRCSTGKTTILNKMFNLNLQVGVDDTTQTLSKVHVDRNKKLAYFDSPGLNEHVNITNYGVFKALNQMDFVFVLTAVTFKEVRKAILVFNKLNPTRLVLVRTQCDKFDTEEEFQVARAKDMSLLE